MAAARRLPAAARARWRAASPRTAAPTTVAAARAARLCSSCRRVAVCAVFPRLPSGRCHGSGGHQPVKQNVSPALQAEVQRVGGERDGARAELEQLRASLGEARGALAQRDAAIAGLRATVQQHADARQSGEVRILKITRGASGTRRFTTSRATCAKEGGGRRPDRALGRLPSSVSRYSRGARREEAAGSGARARRADGGSRDGNTAGGAGRQALELEGRVGKDGLFSSPRRCSSPTTVLFVSRATDGRARRRAEERGALTTEETTRSQ